MLKDSQSTPEPLQPEKKKAKTTRPKPNLYKDLNFITEIKNLFQQTPLIESALALQEAFSQLKNIPQKWTPNTIKTKLTQDGILLYSKTKPAGYSINFQKLDDAIHKEPIEPELNTISEKVTVKRQKRSGTAQKTQKSQIKPSSSVPSPSQPKMSSLIEKKTENELLTRIPSIPRYLLDRMQKETQKLINVGLIEINSYSIDKLEKAIDYLNSDRGAFEPQYDNEREILELLNLKIKYMTQRLENLHEKEAQLKIHKFFVVPLQKGKFDKLIKRIGPDYSIESCAFDLIEKIGRDARNIPLSELALRRKIEEILRSTPRILKS